MQWNTSNAEVYANSSLCGTVETSYDGDGGTGWGTASDSISSSQSSPTSGGITDSGSSLLVGAWRGAPDGIGTDRRGGYYRGLLDNLEVGGLRKLCECIALP